MKQDKLYPLSKIILVLKADDSFESYISVDGGTKLRNLKTNELFDNTITNSVCGTQVAPQTMILDIYSHLALPTRCAIVKDMLDQEIDLSPANRTPEKRDRFFLNAQVTEKRLENLCRYSTELVKASRQQGAEFTL